MRHRPELDGLRGIAVLVVLASHSRLGGFAVEGGLAGVTLFFVLSGFLITSLLAAEFNRGRGVSLRAFYIRRGLRLLPAMGALLVVVTIGYVLSAWPSPPAPQMDLPASLLVVAAYVPNWAQTVIPMGVLGHTWSLGVEEQFYLAWPVILIAGLRFLGPRRLAVAALLVAVLVMPWRYVLMEGGNRVHLFLGTDMHADALLLGCALALLSIRVSPIVGWLGIAGVIATGAWWASGGMGQLLFLPLATIASVAALGGLSGGPGMAPVGLCRPDQLRPLPLALPVHLVGLARTAGDRGFYRRRRRLLRALRAAFPSVQGSLRTGVCG